MQELTMNEIEQVNGGHSPSAGSVAVACIVTTAVAISVGPGIAGMAAIWGLYVYAMN